MDKADEIFEKISQELSEKYKGKIVAIEIDSGDYFIGSNTIDAYEKGYKKHPTREFFFKRIGAKTAFVVG